MNVVFEVYFLNFNSYVKNFCGFFLYFLMVVCFVEVKILVERVLFLILMELFFRICKVIVNKCFF